MQSARLRDARTVIDREKKIVSVYYASDMEPRIAAWRPVWAARSCPSAPRSPWSRILPRMPDAVSVPNFDDQHVADRRRGRDRAGCRRPRAPRSPRARRSVQERAGIYSGHTWGVVVVKDGRIVAERYEPGWDTHTAARTNSMCKSIGVSLVGIGVTGGSRGSPPEGAAQSLADAGDPRGNITLNDLLHMASGLYTEAGGDPHAGHVRRRRAAVRGLDA